MENAEEAPTASALCARAELSRNALYRYHPEALVELRDLQQRRRGLAPRKDGSLQRLQDDNKSLRLKVGQLAALVDHYFAAWREASVSLQRCEKQLSEMRRTSGANLFTVPK